MPDPRPADPWKLARLIAFIAVALAFLLAGSYARLRWGVPLGYGFEEWSKGMSFRGWVVPANPLWRLERQMNAARDGYRPLRNVNRYERTS